MFGQRFRHEVKVSGQHLVLLYLAVPVGFMRGLNPPSGAEINLAEAWKWYWPHTSEILLVFTIFCAARLALVLAVARWRGEI